MQTLRNTRRCPKRESLISKVSELESQLTGSLDDEKLQVAIKDRDRAQADAKKYQEVLGKTEEILTKLQSKFESDLQKWERDLEEKRSDLRAEREKVEELE